MTTNSPAIAPLAEALVVLATGRPLSAEQSGAAVAAIMTGEAGDGPIAAFLTALRVRGETADELAGAVAAVRRYAVPWPGRPMTPALPVVDTCGTGGDGASTVNISTASALVVASTCLARVAKHGNRSASGTSGSAEVLTELGIAVEADPSTLAGCLAELGIAFLFAPKFHPSLRFAAPVRRQLPFRTLFNLVGPLANPAAPGFQLIGVPDARLADLVAGAVARLGIERAAIVTGGDGLDEVSLSGPTRVRWVEGGTIAERTWTPADFGLGEADAADLRITGPAESARAIRDLVAGQPGPVRATVLANAAAALLVTGAVGDLAEGVARAASALDDGRAARLLDRWAKLSHQGEASSQSSSKTL